MPIQTSRCGWRTNQSRMNGRGFAGRRGAPGSPGCMRAGIPGLQDVSGVTEIYAKRNVGDGFRYEQVYASLEAQGTAFRSWASKHSEELANTMAGPAGPDLIALLADGYGFGRIG